MAEPRTPGLRERKKRETRTRISDVATGLFLEHGFDSVTVADVARAADVSVNTVFNYFRTKEDLFFDRQADMIEQAAESFRRRRPGESAVALFRRLFFEGLDSGGYQTGFHEGSEIWSRTVLASPALMARQEEIGRQAREALAVVLAEDTGAGPDEVTHRVVADMIMSAQWRLVNGIVARKLAGECLQEMRDEVYATAARVYDLLERGIGDYAAKPAPPDPAGAAPSPVTALPADAPPARATGRAEPGTGATGK